MHSFDPQTLIIVAVVAVVAVVAAILIAAGAFVLFRKKQSQRLKHRFGPEYGAMVEQLGSAGKAEAELKRREKRVQHLNIVPLPPAEATRFSQAWFKLQRAFIDDPKGVLTQADELVRELLLKRGYPMADFERRAADISVDHPVVVTNYRAAQLIVARNQRGEADTEELRKAVVHFRALFDELLGVTAATDQVTPATKMVVQT